MFIAQHIENEIQYNENCRRSECREKCSTDSMGLAERISDAELEVMKVLWREGRSMPFNAIRVELSEIKKWKKSTIATLLRRLLDKGVVSACEGRGRYYAPNISYGEYVEYEEQSYIDKLYGGDIKKMVTALCSRGKITEADIGELKEYFRMRACD